jgi:hypothetical protein
VCGTNFPSVLPVTPGPSGPATVWSPLTAEYEWPPSVDTVTYPKSNFSSVAYLLLIRSSGSSRPTVTSATAAASALEALPENSAPSDTVQASGSGGNVFAPWNRTDLRSRPRTGRRT